MYLKSYLGVDLTPDEQAIANAASDKTAKDALEALGKIMVVSNIPVAAKSKIMRQFQEWITLQKGERKDDSKGK